MAEVKKPLSFDDYVENYEKEIQSSIGFIGQVHDFFIKVKANMIRDIVIKRFSDPANVNVLDIGCGIGLIDHHLAEYFKNLNGVDVEEGVVGKARKLNPGINYLVYDGTKLPFGAGSMDVVFAINVMHHVDPSGWRRFSDEMFRVVKESGIAIVFEHNPLNPLTRKAVNSCEFDKGAVLLNKGKLKKIFCSAGFKNVHSAYILFFPWMQNFFRKIEAAIKGVPLGAQYFICGTK